MTHCVIVDGMQPPAERLIKRYDNRKLYDPRDKRYVTLEGLARLVADGHELLVHDQKSGADITNTVLAQVILESLRERTAQIPRQVLVRLIRLGMAPLTAAAGRAPSDLAARARDEAEKIAGGLLRRGRLSLEEALALRHEIAATLQQAGADAQRGLEQRFHSLLERSERERGISPALQALKEKLLTLEEPAARRTSRR